MRNELSPRVVTVTANAAIDRVFDVERFEVGRPHRSVSQERYPAGKGVNVSRAVVALGGVSTALGFVGEADAELFSALSLGGVEARFDLVPGSTRENVTIRDLVGRTVTHVTTSGFRVEASDVDRLRESVQSHVRSNDIVCLSGSLPPGSEEPLYGDLVRLCADLRATVILDTSGEALRHGISASPFIVKPNLKELRSVVDMEVNDDEASVAEAALSLGDAGACVVVVSRGRAGVIAADCRDGCVYRVTLKSQLPGNSLGGVGCGDSLVAGMAATLAGGGSLHDSIITGVACGTANLSAECPGALSLSLVHHLRDLVDMVRLA